MIGDTNNTKLCGVSEGNFSDIELSRTASNLSETINNDIEEVDANLFTVDNLKAIPIITGPTGSGKSSFAMTLARLIPNSVIVGADSMQIYKYLDIGTAKASHEDRVEVEHYLIDFLDLEEKFAVDKYQELALETITKLLEEGKVPIVCGGTPQYVTSLAEATKFMPASTDSNMRAKLEERMHQEGSETLLEELAKIDPQRAIKLHPNNKRRIVRALEIAYISGEKQSAWDEEAETLDLDFSFKVYSFDWPREILYERINLRVDKMMDEGLLEEARAVYAADLPSESTCLQAIAYKEFFPYFRGEISLEEAISDLKKFSRRYAKRQLTWFRHKDWIKYLDPFAHNNINLLLNDIF